MVYTILSITGIGGWIRILLSGALERGWIERLGSSTEKVAMPTFLSELSQNN